MQIALLVSCQGLSLSLSKEEARLLIVRLKLSQRGDSVATDRGHILEIWVALRGSDQILATKIHRHNILDAMSLPAVDTEQTSETAMARATLSLCNLTYSVSLSSKDLRIQSSSRGKAVWSLTRNKKTAVKRRKLDLKLASKYWNRNKSQEINIIQIQVPSRNRKLRMTLRYKSTSLSADLPTRELIS